MGNLEKYGVLALIFVIVLILTVAIWHGPGDARKPAAGPGTDAAKVGESGAPSGMPVTTGVAPSDLEGRPALAEMIRKQQEEEARLAAERNQQNAANGIVPGNPGTLAAGQEQPTIEKNPEFRKYRIAKGDTLHSIAKSQLGSSNRWEEIVKANEGLNPNRLKVNMEILIPSGAAVVKSNPGKDTPKAPIKAAKKESPRIAKNTK